MNQKQVETNDSLEEPQSNATELFQTYGKSMSEQQLLTELLSNVNVDSDRLGEELDTLQNTIVTALDSYDKYKNQSLHSYNVVDKFRQFSSFFSIELVCNNNQKLEHSINLHKNFIENMSSGITSQLMKIQQWRKRYSQTKKILQLQARINKQTLKKYNLKNYLQQLYLIKDLKERVDSKLAENIPDFRFVQELTSKQFVPYSFYKAYCFNNCCRVISKRIEIQQLIVIRQSNNIELLRHMETYFLQGLRLSEKCNRFLTMCKFIRLVSSQDLSVEDGFIHLFRSYFLQSMQVALVDLTEFMKSRSIMQSSDQMIDIWHEYESIQVETYVLWHYQQVNWIRKSELIHLSKLTEVIQTFKVKFEWMNEANIKTNKIQGSNNFIEDILKLILLKIIKPFIFRIYIANIPEDKRKSFQKYRKQFISYWIYTLFSRYTKLFSFIQFSLREQLNSFQILSSRKLIEEGQLNQEQYFQYYKQVPEILSENGLHEIGRQFFHFWTEIAARFCKTIHKNQQIRYISKQLMEEIEKISYIQTRQFKLSNITKNKKLLKLQETKDQAYGLLMNLQFSSLNFFLIRQAARSLGKDIQKQIFEIREVALGSFYQ